MKSRKFRALFHLVSLPYF